ncbi:MAG: Flp family type IVb pilin [Planctomycetaceae bacterium]|nr:Flp family type IVb pilin [Planctomycetaceae bacterium]
MSRLKSFLRNEDGTTAVEYCVMLAMILLVLIVGLLSAGGGVANWWTSIDTELDTNGF